MQPRLSERFLPFKATNMIIWASTAALYCSCWETGWRKNLRNVGTVIWIFSIYFSNQWHSQRSTLHRSSEATEQKKTGCAGRLQAPRFKIYSMLKSAREVQSAFTARIIKVKGFLYSGCRPCAAVAGPLEEKNEAGRVSDSWTSVRTRQHGFYLHHHQHHLQLSHYRENFTRCFVSQLMFQRQDTVSALI